MMFATASLRFFINDKMFKFVSREHSKFTQSSQSGEKDKKKYFSWALGLYHLSPSHWSEICLFSVFLLRFFFSRLC